VLQRLLGLERLQLIADRCKERRKEVEHAIALLNAKVEELLDVDLDELLGQLQTANMEHGAWKTQVEELRPELERARTSVAESEASLRGIEKAREAWQETGQTIDRLQREIDATALSIQNAQRAQEKIPDHKIRLETARSIDKSIRELEPAIAEARADKARTAEAGSANWQRLQDTKTELEGLQSLLERADEIRAAAGHVEELEGQTEEAEKARLLAESEVVQARRRVEAHREAEAEARRIADLLKHTEELLEDVPCVGVQEYSMCPLLQRRQEAVDRVKPLMERFVRTAWEGFDLEAQSVLSTAETTLRAARERYGAATDALKVARSAAEDAPRLKDAEPRAEELRGQIQTFEETHAKMIEARDRHASELKRLELQKARHEKHLQEVIPGGLEKWQQVLAEDQAEADKLEERNLHLREVRAERSRLAQSRGGEPSAEDASAALASARVALADLEQDEQRVQKGVDDAGRKIASLEEQIKQAEAALEKRKGYRSDIDRFLQEQADWKLLEKAFGKDGIQALMIDAAGPAISTLCNELLQVTFGTRFRVNLETTKLDSTGKRLIETLDLRVIDSERGREGTIDTLSGGEKVVVGLALRLALILHNNQGGTQLFADEMDGALDGENASRFVPMLRRAMELGGLEQVVFVSHRPECQAAADHVVDVRDGRVEVRS